MSITIDRFAAECHDLLEADPGAGGREKIRARLEQALVDEEFIAAHLGPDNDTPRTTLYEDPELGFCILAHVQKGAVHGKPHDHGSTWAIYGQAKGHTDMTEWRATGRKDDKGADIVEPVETYRLNPGMARLYTDGAVHSTARVAETRLIRITGADVDKLARGRYRAAAEAVPAE